MAVVVGLLIPKLSELTKVLSILSTETAWGTSCFSLSIYRMGINVFYVPT